MCEVLSVVSEDTGVSPRTMAKLRAEGLRENLVCPKGRPRDVTISSTRTAKHDTFTVHAIRLKVQSMYAKREIPILDNVPKAAKEDDGLPNFRKTNLWRLTKDMSLTYDKRIRNLGIIIWCRRYLRAIKEFRRQGRGKSLKNFPGICDLLVAALFTRVNWRNWSVDTFLSSLLALLHTKPIPRAGFVTATKQTVFPRLMVCLCGLTPPSHPCYEKHYIVVLSCSVVKCIQPEQSYNSCKNWVEGSNERKKSEPTRNSTRGALL
ncbi:hypothetical protein HPB48_011937 [Haemaphysalis longicornis]|uniref:Uncharacterized protein n=1 Tax=Haemaphysalis longicornis TaxID=44386 RepID=A0A9J6GR79_HAELO|nr:hypothetical protein HPB48_011937 [Haemaphysalis longicornis]